MKDPATWPCLGFSGQEVTPLRNVSFPLPCHEVCSFRPPPLQLPPRHAKFNSSHHQGLCFKGRMPQTCSPNVVNN